MYFLCEPNIEVHDDANYGKPKTAIARVLCLILMSCLSPVRDHNWRKYAKAQQRTWATSFSLVRSKIPDEELRQTPPDSAHTSFESTSDATCSEWLPSPEPSPPKKTRAQPKATCAPPQTDQVTDPESSNSDSNLPAPRRKRTLSELMSASPAAHQSKQFRHGQRGGNQHNQFCTQRCLLGLQQNSTLDDSCPNIGLHQHQITAEAFLKQLEIQSDKDVDKHCIPYGPIGSYGAPFQVTCGIYGYTVLGKGTTPLHWPEVSREIEVYRLLRAAQGSAIPVFLGAVDMEYFLYGAGEIRHMLIMAWGGENLEKMEMPPELERQIRRSRKETYALGIVHEDMRLANLLWNVELQRVLFIDFHRSRLSRRLKNKHSGSSKRSSGDLREQLLK